MIPDTCIVGIDPSSTKLAVVTLIPGHRGWKVLAHKYTLGPKYHPTCTLHATAAIRRHVTQSPIADQLQRYAFVEAPVVGKGGVRSTMVQAFTSGATQAALLGAGFNVELVQNTAWKKSIVGSGNAAKGDVAEALRLRWPVQQARVADDQDLLDALAIALYGATVVGGGQGLDGVGELLDLDRHDVRA